MQVFLNDIHPFGIPGLIIQLLTEHTKDNLPTGIVCIILQILSGAQLNTSAFISQESRGVKTGHLKADEYPEAQGIRKEKRRTERGA